MIDTHASPMPSTEQPDSSRPAMRLSIAMCTFNGGKYLSEQLASIQAQTRQPFELVVRDDGSTDGTLAMLEAFASRAAYPVRVTRNEKNMHFTGNFMMAASQCMGDCVVFCDQDDIWEKTKLEEIEASATLHQADLYLHEGLVVDGSGMPTGTTMPDHAKLTADPHSPPYDQGAKGFAMAVRKAVIDEMLSHWDWDYYFDFRRKFGSPLGHDQLIYAWCVDRKVALISKTLVRYRVHESNVTASQTMTGGWMTRMARKARLIQFAEFNYERFADKWAAEVAFMGRMFPNQPPGIRKLSDYLQELSTLWRARADVHDKGATRPQRLSALRRFWSINRSMPLTARFSRAAIAKDLALALLRTRSRS